MDDRIVRARIETIRRRALLGSIPIGGWQSRTAEHRAPSEYRFDGDWMPADLPSSWPAGRTLFLRAEVTFPAAAEGERRCLSFDTRLLEGLLSVDGRPFAGIDQEHQRVPSPPAGRRLLEAEFTCVPAAFHSPEALRETALLREARCDAVHPGMEAFAWDAQFAWEAARCVRDARRRALIEAALEKALLFVDLTAPDKELQGAVAAARLLLRGLAASIGSDPEEGRVYLTGHSHIDTAWLWPLHETIRKCGRTFATACRLMERYPDYRFTCSQPQLYAYTKKHFPSLYEEIRGWIKAGRWECTGGMWVEADCNVPSGESLVRQFLHGIAFFQEEFGKRPRGCWLPDVFGYPGSLPGILAGCGITSFYTNKLHWQARNPFPAHLFRWEGIDGSTILAHIPRLPDYYNGFPNPAQLRAAWEGFNEKALHQEVMFPFGHGDGGGGPTEAMLEFAERARSFPGLPVCRQGLAESWFDEVAAANPELPVWTGELYLETHRGTYTTQSPVKKANRANELALRDAELWGSIADIECAGSPPEGDTWHALRGAWRELLLLQFHDILPGSSIGEVYREAAKSHAEIAKIALEAKGRALARLDSPGSMQAAAGEHVVSRRASTNEQAVVLTAFNSLSWDRSDPVEASIPDIGKDVEVVLPDGSTVPAQRVSAGIHHGEKGRARIVFVPSSIPAIGMTRLSVRTAAPASARVRSEAAPGGGLMIESPLYVVRVDPDGAIVGLLDRKNAREVVPRGHAANMLQLFQDGPETESAWNIHGTLEKRRYAWDGPAVMRVVEEGPVRLVLRITRSRRESSLEQDMIVWADHGRMDFVTRAEWQERQVLLKAAFPVSVRSDSASYEVQFGAVRRPTHRNTSWEQEKFEVCAHRWMDLSESGYGVSVLNDSRYGCDVRANVLRLTLLRGAEWPDPDADRGRHDFTYSLFPHAGDWTDAGTVQNGWELSVPVTCVSAAGGAEGGAEAPVASRSFFRVHGPAVLQALKRAEDGNGFILRFYEPHGGRGAVEVTAPRQLAAVAECNHVEEGGTPCDVDGAAFRFSLLPFQVRTFRVRF